MKGVEREVERKRDRETSKRQVILFPTVRNDCSSIILANSRLSSDTCIVVEKSASLYKKLKRFLSKSKGCRVVKSTTGSQCKLTSMHGMVTRLTC